MIKEYLTVHFTSKGREYDVDERLISRIDPHHQKAGAHHIYLVDGTYFCATNIVRINVIRQVKESCR